MASLSEASAPTAILASGRYCQMVPGGYKERSKFSSSDLLMLRFFEKAFLVLTPWRIVLHAMPETVNTDVHCSKHAADTACGMVQSSLSAHPLSSFTSGYFFTIFAGIQLQQGV